MQDKNRRRRLKRPRTLVFIAVLFFLFPVFSYVGLALENQSPLLDPRFLMHPVHFPALLFLIAAPVVGYGLLQVQKWGWWSFLFFSCALILYNLGSVLANFNTFNAGTVVRVVLMTAAVVYFARRDIAAPYMRLYPRGWRLERREPRSMPVSVDGETFMTRDIGEAGFYALTPGPDFKLNQRVSVRLDRPDGAFELEAGVVRMDPDGFGVAFRHLDRSTRRELQSYLKHYAPAEEQAA